MLKKKSMIKTQADFKLNHELWIKYCSYIENFKAANALTIYATMKATFNYLWNIDKVKLG